MKKMPPLSELAKFFGILSIESRLVVLHALMDGPKNVTQLVSATGLKQSNLSKQLKILADAGIIARKPRHPEIEYSISNTLVYNLCEMVCSKILSDNT